MSRKLARYLLMTAVAVMFLMANCVTAAAAESYTIPLTVKYGQTEARTMLDMVNKFRQGSDAWYYKDENKTEKVTVTDLKPLEYDYGLEQIAMQRAAEIAVSFSHTRPDGTSCFTVTADNGARSWGENIAAGYGMCKTAASAFETWQETNYGYSGQGHRRAMLDSGYTHIGIAHVVVNGADYWVQEFGRSPSGTAKTNANNSSKIVNVSVDKASMEELKVLPSYSEVKLSLGKCEAVPTAQVSFNTKNNFPGRGITVTENANWKVSGNAVTVSGGKITAKSVGTATLTATVFGSKLSVKVIVECTDHKWSSWNTAKAATCTEKGSQTRKCSLCGKTETKQIAAKGHSFGAYKVTKAATCTEPGTETRTCSACNKAETRQIAAVGHKWGEYKTVKAATVDAEGTEERTCSVCKKTEQRKTAKLTAQTTTTKQETEEPVGVTDSEGENEDSVASDPDGQGTDTSEGEAPDSGEVTEDSSDTDEGAPDAAAPDYVGDDSAASADDAYTAEDTSASDLIGEPEPPAQDTPVSSEAQTDDSGELPLLYIIVGACAALVLGLIIVFAVRRKKDK